jgi:hypothetical protein
MPMTFPSPTPIAIQIPFYAVVYFDDSRRKDKGRMSYALIRPFVHKTKRSRKPAALVKQTEFYNRWCSCCQPQRTINDKQKRKNMTTSRKEASQAGKDLRNPKTPKRDRGPIASDLAQAPRKPKK